VVDENGISCASGGVGLDLFQYLKKFLCSLFHAEVAKSKSSFGLGGVHNCSWEGMWVAHFYEEGSGCAELSFV